MPDNPKNPKSEQDLEIRQILEGVLDQFGKADKQDLLKEIARGQLELREMRNARVQEGERLKRQAQDAEAQLDILRKDLLVVEEREKELHTTTSRAQEEREQERQAYERKIAQADEAVEAVKAELSRALARERTTSKRGEKVEAERTEIRRKVEALEEETRKSAESLRAREVLLKEFQERLEGERKSHQEDADELRAKVKELTSKVEEAAKSEGAEAKLAEVSTALAEAEGALQARQTTLQAQARDMEKLRRDAGASGRYLNTIRILEQEVNTAAEKISELEQDATFLKEKLDKEQTARREKTEELQARIRDLEGGERPEGPAGEGDEGPSSRERELEGKVARLESEAKKWREAFEGKREEEGDDSPGGVEGRLVEVEIALAKEEAEHREEVTRLRAQVSTLEKEVATRRESEETLRSDVEEITALARAERESFEEERKRLATGSAPAGDDGGAMGRQIAERMEEIRSEIDKIGEQAQEMIAEGEKIEESLAKVRDLSRGGGGEASKQIGELRNRSSEIAEMVEGLAQSLQGGGSPESGEWGDLEAAVRTHREKQKDLLERVSRIRDEIAAIADPAPEAVPDTVEESG